MTESVPGISRAWTAMYPNGRSAYSRRFVLRCADETLAAAGTRDTVFEW